MRYQFLLLSTLIMFGSTSALAKNKLIASPVNSPVKETYLQVKLQGDDSISEVTFKPKTGGSETSGELAKEGAHYIGKLNVSHLKPGIYEYRVKVRVPSGKSAKDEAASLAFVKFEIDQSLEVADPGEEGKKTLEGIDSDKNGIRDDIQRWLNETYQSKPSTKEALKQMAKSMNKSLLNSSNKTTSNLHSHDIGYAIDCLTWIDPDNFIKIEKGLRKRFYNTSERIKTKLMVDTHFHGEGLGPRRKYLSPLQWNTLCEFNPTKGQ